jgi:acyl dehydratase
MIILIVAVVASTLLFFALLTSHASNIFKATGALNGRLTFTPARLSGIDLTVLVILVILKYINKLIGYHPMFTPAKTGKDIVIPPLTLSAPLHVDTADLERFAAAIGAETTTSDDENSSPLLLPAVTTPLLIILLSNRNCPVLPFGAVNTRNRFEFLDPSACQNATCLKDATVIAHLGGDKLLGKRVKRGMEFEIVVEVEGKFQESSARKVIFRQVIGILVFLPKTTKPLWEISENTQTTNEPLEFLEEPPQQIRLAMNAPVKWSAVCKDVNPIHMSSLAAKLFGFPGKIAHGNHVAAHFVEKQRDIDIPSRRLFWQTDKPWFLEVDFKRPMVLPLLLEIKFAAQNKDSSRNNGRFEILRGEKSHISGNFGELT